MKIRIDVKTENAAFKSDWRKELLRIIEEALPKIHDDVESVHLRDVHGQVVGKLTRIE